MIIIIFFSDQTISTCVRVCRALIRLPLFIFISTVTIATDKDVWSQFSQSSGSRRTDVPQDAVCQVTTGQYTGQLLH